MPSDISIPRIRASRIVVMMPNWLGDGVMATPFLRALRGLYPEAHIAAIALPLVAPVLAGLAFVNEVRVAEKKDKLSRWLREGRFDLGIVLPNSFRSAWTMFRGGVRRRLGYARDQRTILLTDRILPTRKTTQQWLKDEAVRTGIQLVKFEEPIADGELLKVEVVEGWRGKEIWTEHRMRSTGNIQRQNKWEFQKDDFIDARVLRANYQPVPTIDYYLELAKYLGAENPTRAMELGITPAELAEADSALAQAQITTESSATEKLVTLVPGANFGSSKCWPPERFAALAQALADPAGAFAATVLLATSPSELEIAKVIHGDISRHRERVHMLAAFNDGRGISVGALKVLVRRSQLMICNDTGPRHFAAAFGVPTVTLFGPTDPVWADTFSARETVVRVPVPCGPCQLKTCPIDHRCMKRMTVEQVLEAARAMWG